MTEAEWLVSDDPVAMLRAINHRNARIAPKDSPLWDYKLSDRKLRLFACACVRQVWHLLTDSQRVKVVFAEKEPFQQSVGSVHAVYLSQDGITEYVRSVGEARCLDYACNWLGAVNALEVAEQAPAWLQKVMEFQTQAALFRTIVGNPWRPVIVGSAWTAEHERLRPGVLEPRHTVILRDWLTWKDGTIPKMTQVIYDERRWSAMPMLADALEEAGCEDEAILRWCRGQERCYEDTCMGRGWGRESPCRVCYGTGWIPRRGQSVRGDWCLDLLLGRE